jgi:hypothetical protein
MNSLVISPVSDRFPISANEKIERSFKVRNTSTEKLTIRLYPEQFSSDEYSQIIRWIVFSEPEVELEPSEEKVITYKVNTPESIPDGGQYCNIIAEIEREAESNIQVASRVAIKINAINHGSTNEQVGFSDLELKMVNIGGPAAARTTVSNNGNVDFQTEVKLTKSSIFGEEISSSKMLISLYPGESKQVYIQAGNNTAFGIYKMHYEVAAVDKTIDETYYALVIPIHSLFILVAVVLAFLAVVIHRREIRQIRLERETLKELEERKARKNKAHKKRKKK